MTRSPAQVPNEPDTTMTGSAPLEFRMSAVTRRRLIKRFAALALLACMHSAHAERLATVAAASDLKFALEEVAARFTDETGETVRLVFGSSGTFYSQILQGAPFDLYLSADEQFVFDLAAAGKTVDRGRLYAYGRIGLFVPTGAPLVADGELTGLADALTDGRIRKFAIANPAHAPYGQRAREALQHAGLWARIEPYLVLGENVSQATQFAVSGSTEGGIIALSLALSPAVKVRGTFALISESWHQRLAQRMVVLAGAHPTAERFYDYLASPAAKTIMQGNGFELPDE
jgi:molybdate transport system substrate-binding protein